MIKAGEDVQDNEIIQTLKSMQQVKAPANFEADLFRRINQEKYAEEKQPWIKFLPLPKLIPSLGLSVVVLALFFVITFNSTTKVETDPFAPIPIQNKAEIRTLNMSGTNNYIFRPVYLNSQEKAQIYMLKERLKKFYREQK